jgi:hypothetical protein
LTTDHHNDHSSKNQQTQTSLKTINHKQILRYNLKIHLSDGPDAPSSAWMSAGFAPLPDFFRKDV